MKLAHARNSLGVRVRTFEADLNHLDRIPDLVGELKTAAGHIDVLTNQTAVFALTREVWMAMVARGSGTIIMKSSMASRYSIPSGGRIMATS